MPSSAAWSTRRCSHQPPPTMSRCRSGIRGRSSATASSASSICLCGTSRDSTATRGVADRGSVTSVRAGASSSPLRTTAMWSGFTPRSVRSRADGSDTVTYWLRRCSRGDNRDSTNQPIRPARDRRPATVRGGSGAPAPRPVGRRRGGPGTGVRSGCRSPRRAAPAAADRDRSRAATIASPAQM